LFNAITKAGAEAANYPFCTIEPNVGVVDVPDPRLAVLTEMYNAKKTVPTSISFLDIAGLVKGAAQGEGLGNKFLSHIRQVDAVVHIVRCFADNNITHVEGSVDPMRDIEIIDTELCLADIETVNKRLERLQKLAKSGDKKAKAEQDLLTRIQNTLNKALPARNLELTYDEKVMLQPVNLLTLKPVLFVANTPESDIANAGTNNIYVQKLKKHADTEKSEVITISAKMESEIAELEPGEAVELLKELGVEDSGLNKLIKASFKLLGLITFLTAGEKEVRAWTITDGTKAPQAGGKIHSDIERGFIRAEIVSYRDLIAAGSQNAAKEKGQVRLEGKDYIMKDGDVTYFRFNV
jgi:GTP-binding protein YchF